MAGIFSILSIFLNPFFLLAMMIPVVGFLFLYIGVYISQPRKNRIIQIAPETGRGRDYEVAKEDAVNLYCNPLGESPPQRFIKLYDAFNIVRKGPFKLQHFGLWVGRIGTAYTYTFGNETVKVKLEQTMKTILGEDKYKLFSDETKAQIESASIGVTIEFPKAELTPKGLPSLSSDDIRRHDIDHFISSLAQGIANLLKGRGRGNIVQVIMCVGTGIGIGFIIAFFLKVGGTTVVQQGTTHFIERLIR